MLYKTLVILAFSSFELLSSTVVLADVDNCDKVLVEQIDTGSLFQSSSLDWLALVSDKNYDTAKKSASGAIGGMFSADYSSFEEKRRELFTENHYSSTQQEARENFKSHLDSSQITAWVNCKNEHTELAHYFTNVDSDGANLVLVWKAPSYVGPLKNISAEFGPGSATQPPIKDLTVLDGERQFIVKRAQPGMAVRAVVAGTTGVNDHSFSIGIYLPKYENATPPQIPPRNLVPETNQVHRSRALWAGGRDTKTFECLTAPEGYDLVIARESPRYLGGARGQCLDNNRYCNKRHEWCEDDIIQDGCLVSSVWHAWYKAELTRLNLPYSSASVCAPKLSGAH